VGIFFLLAAVLSWTVWLWPVDVNGRLRIFLFGFWHIIPFSLIKLLIGNCLPGLLAVLWTWSEGADQFRSIVSTLTKWRTPVYWYIFVLALPLALFLVSLCAVLVFFPVQHPPVSARGVVITLLITLPFGPLWEELAWRAFALTKLESRYSRLASALILGSYWAVWHIPLWLSILNLSNVNAIPVLASASLSLVAWSVIWSYFYHRTSESLPVVILLHSMHIAAWTHLFAAVPLPQFVYISSGLAVCLSPFFARSLVDSQSAQIYRS
jgi:membrane protease YdiL (CAAX protease family)